MSLSPDTPPIWKTTAAIMSLICHGWKRGGDFWVEPNTSAMYNQEDAYSRLLAADRKDQSA